MPQASSPLRVLFLGNRGADVNDLPQLVQAVAEGGWDVVLQEQSTRPIQVPAAAARRPRSAGACAPSAPPPVSKTCPSPSASSAKRGMAPDRV